MNLALARPTIACPAQCWLCPVAGTDIVSRSQIKFPFTQPVSSTVALGSLCAGFVEVQACLGADKQTFICASVVFVAYNSVLVDSSNSFNGWMVWGTGNRNASCFCKHSKDCHSRVSAKWPWRIRRRVFTDMRWNRIKRAFSLTAWGEIQPNKAIAKSSTKHG